MLPVSRVIGHKEWAPGRKSDPTYDMNWRRACVASVQPRVSAPPPAPKELFMALTEAQEKTILEAAESVLFGQAGVRSAGRMAMAVSNLQQSVDGLTAKVDEIAAKPGATVDTAPIVAAVVEAVAEAGVAQQVIDALAERLAANPA